MQISAEKRSADKMKSYEKPTMHKVHAVEANGKIYTKIHVHRPFVKTNNNLKNRQVHRHIGPVNERRGNERESAIFCFSLC